MHVPAEKRSEKSVFLKSFSTGETVMCCRVASVCGGRGLTLAGAELSFVMQYGYHNALKYKTG